MDDATKKKEIHKALFASLVTMLSSSAMQQLGKLVNPMSGKTETNLEGAQVTIDMLEMLRDKTLGNLDDEESKIINDLLSSLQINYVETAKEAANKPAADASADEEPKADADEPAEAPADKGEKDKGEKKEPKFRKSYGA